MSSPDAKKLRDGHFHQSIGTLAPSLQREMQQLRKHEDAIVKLMGDPKTSEQFLANPLRVLQEHGIAVPPLLKRRLQQFDPATAQHLRRQVYALPNGQTVTARIRVRFTNGPKGV